MVKLSQAKKTSSITKIFALGGLNEVGKNTYCIENGDAIIIIDAGIKFAEKILLGVQAVIPDYNYLIANAHKIKGLFITHGHEDHLGAIPYLLQKVNIPKIYSPNFASDLIKLKLKSYNSLKNLPPIVQITENKKINLSPFKISFFRVTHSVPNSFGIVIDTPDGRIVTTGDFKLDWSPLGKKTSLHKIAQIGQEGVALLMSDSTNSEIPGFNITEKIIINNITNHFKKISKRIFITTFASNFNRIFWIILAAQKANKKVVIIGKAIQNIIDIVIKKKYFALNSTFFIKPEEVKNLPSEKVIVICTGSQGEPNSTISKLADGICDFVEAGDDNMVIFSSKPIPGNKYDIEIIVNKLEKRGIKVYTSTPFDPLHASGHACQEEQKIMLSLINPKYFMPIHGEHKMLKIHGQTASQLGINKENIFICQNGQQLYLSQNKVWMGDFFNVPPVFIGKKHNAIDSLKVLNERRLMLQNGLIVVILWINFQTKKLLQLPQFIFKGSFYLQKEFFLSRKLLVKLTDALNLLLDKNNLQIDTLHFQAENIISQTIYDFKKINPLIQSIILQKKENIKN